MQQPVTIYVLQLQHGKYYVGKTKNPTFRLQDHIEGCGSQWTQLYKPRRVVAVVPNCDDYDEDKYTRKYMDQYGIENVRGGSFSSVNLPEHTVAALEQMQKGTNNLCFLCGDKGHFTVDCELKDALYKEDENDEEEEEEEEEKHDYYDKRSKRAKIVCYRCNREGHYAPECLVSRTFRETPSNMCYRCGRNGHYISDCYAVKHVRGYYLN